jgi:hypothetical protein
VLPKEFVLSIDHKDLYYINNQSMLNQKHSKWIDFLQNYSLVLNHMSERSNRVADGLS